ncbi:MAG TPA: hypothetical protein VHF06_04920 [Pseudonocardiaceae bacterium]|nr:hypothetical protein [Pseudonocardiaceae bacterium]
MGFFDDVLLTDDRPSAPELQTVQPARNGPPEGWVLPTVLPSVRLLARSANARIALVGLRCWPDGVSMDLQLMCRERRAAGDHADHWAFRFGAQYADRRRVAVGDHPVLRRTTIQSSDGLVLRPTIGGGGRFHRSWGFYLWPLPPKGRLTLVVDWPAEGIPETYTELDAGEIRSAAARAVVMWRDLPHAAAGDRPADGRG